MPVEIFDAHFHIIDPRYPLVASQGYLPNPYGCEQYLAEMTAYQLVGGAVVSGSFQAFDQGYLLAALERLGDHFVGVTQLPVEVTDEEIIRLHDLGVRALRFNVRRGGSEGVDQLQRMAWRVHEICGWHVELYVDSLQLQELYPVLCEIPKFCIDHLGLSQAGLPWLLRVVEQGGWVKACGFGRCDLDVPAALKQIYRVNPAALMFGSDLPGTRAPRRFGDSDVALIMDALGEEGAARVLRKNALERYSPGN